MMSKEDVVSLVVESDGTPAAELRFVMKQCTQHATYAQTQPRAEVIQDNLENNMSKKSTFRKCRNYTK